MINLFYLTILGSIFTIFFIVLKNPLIHKYGGTWYYYIWILVLICYCFPYKIDIFKHFHTTIQYQQQNIEKTELSNDISLHLENNPVLESEKSNMSTMFYKISAKKVIYYIYIIGFLYCLSYYIFCYIRFQIALKNTIKVTDKQYLHCFKSVCSEMKIKRNIILKKSTFLISPISVGIVKPMIILPDIDFEIADFTMILKHELTHYKKRDMLYRLFAILIHIVHWFNPISYIALCTIQEACEYACDETVTKNMDIESKIKYGNMILNQIQSSKKRELFFAGFSQNYKNKNILKRRIAMIKNEKKHKRMMITLLCIFATIVCSNFFHFRTINANQNITFSNEKKQQNNTMHNINQHFAETLTEHQLKVIYKFVDESNIDAETRDLTDSEQQRLKSLKNQYLYSGIRPKKELPLEAGKQEFYIDFSNRIYHYPERELTDEELLQLVEWRLKVNYALSLRNAEQNLSVPSSNNITESEAIMIAKQNVANLFDVEVTDLQIGATFYQNSDIQPDGWFVRLYPKGDMPYQFNWNYAVWIHSGNIEIARSSQTYQLEETQNVNKELVLNNESWINKAKSVVEQKFGEKNIVSADIIDIEDTNKAKVDIKVTISANSYYIVSLYFPNQSLKGISHIVL